MKDHSTQIVETVRTVPRLMDPREAAECLGRSERWLEQDRWRGPTIPFVKIGRSVRYSAEDIVAYIEANRVEPPNNGEAA